MKWQLALLAVTLLASACHKSRRSASFTSNHSIAEEEALASSVILRDPNHPGASFNEHHELNNYDVELQLETLDAGYQPYYQYYLELARRDAGIDGSVLIEVAEDFRFNVHLDDRAGAVAGHSYILVDGKFLDALWEISSFLAMSDLGLVYRDWVEAFDEVIYLHQQVLGSTQLAFLYPFEVLDSYGQELAEAYFLTYVSALLYQEFGHLFYRHALENLRRDGFLEPLAETHYLQEDRADVISGMLLAKVGHPVELAVEMWDLLTFFYIQRFDPAVTYDQILEPSFQDGFVVEDGNTLTERKYQVIYGYDRYLDYWACCY
jgi:hypothetical protein